MNLQYYPESDMLYIELSKGVGVESDEVAPEIVLDLDEEQRVIGIEMEDAGTRIALSRLEVTALPLINLVFSERSLIKA